MGDKEHIKRVCSTNQYYDDFEFKRINTSGLSTCGQDCRSFNNPKFIKALQKFIDKGGVKIGE